MSQVASLREPRRIGIIGGGPSGALTGLQLRRVAAEVGREVEVLVFDRRQFGVTGPRGCNMCAGIVSSALIDQLESIGIRVPPATIQRRIEAYTLEVPGAQVRLKRPPGARIYTAFRSGGPMGEEFGTERSFDHFLLQAAVAAGAKHLPRVVRGVRLPDSRGDPVVLTDAEGEEYEVDAVIGAFGVNSRTAGTFAELGFGYRPPRTVTAAQCEIALTPERVEAFFGNEVHVFCLRIPGVSFAAMVPKERHVTVSLVGGRVGHPQLEEFLQLPEVRSHLPPDWTLPERYCHCHPRLPMSAARNVVADRVLVVGDAHISRHLKNGLDSAFVTASLAARAVIHGGVSRANLVRRYVMPCRKVFYWDNICAQILLGMQGLVVALPWLAASHLRVAAREQEGPEPGALSTLLWGMMTGDENYPRLLRRALSPRLQLRLAWAGAQGAWRRALSSSREAPPAVDSADSDDE